MLGHVGRLGSDGIRECKKGRLRNFYILLNKPGGGRGEGDNKKYAIK